MYEFLADAGYGIDAAALRDRYAEVPWKSFADWAGTIDWRAPPMPHPTTPNPPNRACDRSGRGRSMSEPLDLPRSER
jgi:hypothetical protein